MIQFVNKLTGDPMWVADSRVEEYKAAGHKPAASSVEVKPEEEKPKSRSKKK